MRVVLVTGGFDPLHSGHIKYFEAAKQLGDKLIVGLSLILLIYLYIVVINLALKQKI
tara:strand:- start:342 stop:512 length:171 start_codon:yes stop_codon:yes gene_type:complete